MAADTGWPPPSLPNRRACTVGVHTTRCPAALSLQPRSASASIPHSSGLKPPTSITALRRTSPQAIDTAPTSRVIRNRPNGPPWSLFRRWPSWTGAPLRLMPADSMRPSARTTSAPTAATSSSVGPDASATKEPSHSEPVGTTPSTTAHNSVSDASSPQFTRSPRPAGRSPPPAGPAITTRNLAPPMARNSSSTAAGRSAAAATTNGVPNGADSSTPDRVATATEVNTPPTRAMRPSAGTTTVATTPPTGFRMTE